MAAASAAAIRPKSPGCDAENWANGNRRAIAAVRACPPGIRCILSLADLIWLAPPRRASCTARIASVACRWQLKGNRHSRSPARAGSTSEAQLTRRIGRRPNRMALKTTEVHLFPTAASEVSISRLLQHGEVARLPRLRDDIELVPSLAQHSVVDVLKVLQAQLLFRQDRRNQMIILK